MAIQNTNAVDNAHSSPISSHTGPADAAPPAHPAESTHGVSRAIELLQTLLTGLVLAFVFRAFMVEPFIIPTGSMADALLGAHATQICPACGYAFDFAPVQDATPTGGGFVAPPQTVCPICQLDLEVVAEKTIPKAGDRLLVHKWPFALGGPLRPQRWDVIVFRDPADAEQHYIKRVAGLPRESIEIIDGDVFIDGHIARKPPHVQRNMWLPVFNQAFATRAAVNTGEPRWIVRDPPPPGQPGWTGLDARVLRYAAEDKVWRRLEFNPDAHPPGQVPEYLLDFHAYNRSSSGVYVGDVRVVLELTRESDSAALRVEFVRPPYAFTAQLDPDGWVSLRTDIADGPTPRIVEPRERIDPLLLGRATAIEFGHVDCRAYVSLNGETLLDVPYDPDLETRRQSPGGGLLSVAIAARGGTLTVRRLRLDRDVHYVNRGPRIERALPGVPFELLAGEYFVLGDNSSDSHDSREWSEAGPHLPPDYRLGTVRGDQIVGLAAFVYLPGLLPLDERGRWYVPDLGRVRFVR